MMKKHVWILCAALWAVLLLTACGGKAVAEGWYLSAANGTSFLITEDGEPIQLSDQSEDGGLFDGLSSGDRIRITHDGVEETYPARTGAYSCKLLAEGGLSDLPEEPLASLEALGWDLGLHDHAPAEEPLTVEDPISGYCGNTVTKVTLDGEEYSFWGDDSVVLTDILINLAYDPAQVCRCMTEFTVATELGDGYGVNLTEHYARCDAGQAALTEEQTETIRGILARNCA